MRYGDFIQQYATRLGVTPNVAQHLVDEFCEELLRQAALGEEVSLPKLGKFMAVVPNMKCRVSNLPGMKGKISTPRTKKRLVFKAYSSANRALLGRAFTDFSAPASALHERARKGAVMAKGKKGKHRVIDVPEGVEQITINFPTETKKKKKGKGESTGSRQRLLG